MTEGATVGLALHQSARALRFVTNAPRLEAEVLLAHTMGCSRSALLAHPEWELAPERWRGYWSTVVRRVGGYPLPYLTGRTEFYGLDLAVGPSVLIPRPATETVVEMALTRRPRTMVDVGTGSGCIAVATAMHLPEVQVVATDLSAAALRVAIGNVRRHGVADRVHLVQCDTVRAVEGPVDLVVANLPYVAGSEWPTVQRSVRLHEPRLALDGGSDGLTAVRKLLVDAPRVLRPGGAMLVEIGAAQGEAAMAAARSLLPGCRAVVHPDLARRDRVLAVELCDTSVREEPRH